MSHVCTMLSDVRQSPFVAAHSGLPRDEASRCDVDDEDIVREAELLKMESDRRTNPSLREGLSHNGGIRRFRPGALRLAGWLGVPSRSPGLPKFGSLARWGRGRPGDSPVRRQPLETTASTTRETPNSFGNTRRRDPRIRSGAGPDGPDGRAQRSGNHAATDRAEEARAPFRLSSAWA